MIEKIYEIEGINDKSIDWDNSIDPSFVSADLPSFLKGDGSKIHSIQELLEKSKICLLMSDRDRELQVQGPRVTGEPP
jgi:hypothetical protein